MSSDLEMVECPSCGIALPAATRKCSCGFILQEESSSGDQSHLTRDPNESQMPNWNCPDELKWKIQSELPPGEAVAAVCEFTLPNTDRLTAVVTDKSLHLFGMRLRRKFLHGHELEIASKTAIPFSKIESVSIQNTEMRFLQPTAVSLTLFYRRGKFDVLSTKYAEGTAFYGALMQKINQGTGE